MYLGQPLLHGGSGYYCRDKPIRRIWCWTHLESAADTRLRKMLLLDNLFTAANSTPQCDSKPLYLAPLPTWKLSSGCVDILNQCTMWDYCYCTVVQSMLGKAHHFTKGLLSLTVATWMWVGRTRKIAHFCLCTMWWLWSGMTTILAGMC